MKLTKKLKEEIAETLTFYPVDGSKSIAEACELIGIDPERSHEYNDYVGSSMDNYMRKHVDYDGNVINGDELATEFYEFFYKKESYKK